MSLILAPSRLSATEPAADAAAPVAARGVAVGRLFLWLALPLYTLFALITPPFQTPDEHQHLFRTWQIASGQIIADRAGGEAGGWLPPGLPDAAARELGDIAPHASDRPLTRRSIDEAMARATAIGADAEPRFVNFFGAIIYSPASYLPQLVAVWIGAAAAMPVEHILLLGRLLNAVLAVLLLFAAIRIAPVARMGFFWVGLFPMTVASAASFGQDGLQIGGLALLTAVGLRAHRAARWHRADIALLLGVGALISLAKFVYLPMLALAALPRPRAVRWLRWSAPIAAAVALAALLVALWLAAVAGVMVDVRPGIPPAGERLAGFAADPLALVALLVRTADQEGVTIFESLFTFGWANIGPVQGAMLPSLTALGLVLLAGDANAAAVSRAQRAWLMLLACCVSLLIALALYFTYTPASAATIEGIQGRYLIPLMPAVLVALARRRTIAGPLPEVGAAALLVIANLAVLAVIARVFYV